MPLYMFFQVWLGLIWLKFYVNKVAVKPLGAQTVDAVGANVLINKVYWLIHLRQLRQPLLNKPNPKLRGTREREEVPNFAYTNTKTLVFIAAKCVSHKYIYQPNRTKLVAEKVLLDCFECAKVNH